MYRREMNETHAPLNSGPFSAFIVFSQRLISLQTSENMPMDLECFQYIIKSQCN